MKKFRSVILLLSLLLLQAQEKLLILKGPYIQNLQKESVVIMWETNLPSNSQLQITATKKFLKIIPVKKTRTIEGDTGKKIHEIKVDNLKPNKTYHYKVFSTTNDLKISESGMFTTAPKSRKPFKFIVYGDTRSDPKSHKKVVDAILTEEDIDFVIHTGDLIGYGGNYEMWGDEFFEPAKELMKNICLWPCLGNHEANAKWYFDFFSLPKNERWFSFIYSNSLFITLDIYFSDLSPGSEQYKWLEDELSKAETTWKFIYFHAPVWSSGPHAKIKDGKPVEKEIRLAQEHLVPLFEKYKVDIVFSGHDHLYERSEKSGVHYIIAGGGGAPLYSKSVSNPYSKVCKVTYHYCVVEINGKQLSLKAKDTDGNIIDEITIKK